MTLCSRVFCSLVDGAGGRVEVDRIAPGSEVERGAIKIWALRDGPDNCCRCCREYSESCRRRRISRLSQVVVVKLKRPLQTNTDSRFTLRWWRVRGSRDDAVHQPHIWVANFKADPLTDHRHPLQYDISCDYTEVDDDVDEYQFLQTIT